MRHLYHLLAAAACLAALTLAHSSAAADTGAGVIAYATGPDSAGRELHLINPDATGDHVIWSAPGMAQVGISAIDWRPDGGELAFASDHEAARSFYESDIYAIRPEGVGLRRLTNGPDPSSLAGYPTGSVTVNVNIGASGGPFLVYVLGAREPQTIGTSGQLTFTDVADLGPGVNQVVVAIEGFHRWITPGVAPDVLAGQSVAAGTLDISGEGYPYRALAPTWRSDGSSVGFVLGSGCGSFRQVAADPGPGQLGETLIAPEFALGYTCLLDRSPAPALADQILYSEYDIGAGHIFRTVEGSAEAGDELLQYDSGEQLLDLKWLPDGSGFLFTLTGDYGSYSNIYRYTFATGQTDPVTSFTSEFAGHLSVSPDGQTVVFERAPDMESPASLWLIQLDGSNLRQLVARGARPAWSPSHLLTLSHRAFLPLVGH